MTPLKSRPLLLWQIILLILVTLAFLSFLTGVWSGDGRWGFTGWFALGASAIVVLVIASKAGKP
jgi:hypothetical protein